MNKKPSIITCSRLLQNNKTQKVKLLYSLRTVSLQKIEARKTR